MHSAQWQLGCLVLSVGSWHCLAPALDLVCKGAAEDALEELWRGPPGARSGADGFPQPRMHTVLEVLGGSVAGCLERGVEGWDVWGGGIAGGCTAA
jgi:hypothetical protein